MTTTKLIHIADTRRPGDFNAFAFCGRRVNLFSTVHVENGEEATCTNCQRKAGMRA